MRSIQVFAVMAAGITLPACSSAVRKPHLLHPGPAPFQQANAEVFDPFPQNDMGPAIDGGRPRDVGPPRSQVERAQDFLRSNGARPRQEVAAAPVAIGPPLPVTQPAPVAQPAPVVVPGPVISSPRY
jgi:hypothetical protein